MSPALKRCPACSAENRTSAAFCARCGSGFPAEEESSRSYDGLPTAFFKAWGIGTLVATLLGSRVRGGMEGLGGTLVALLTGMAFAFISYSYLYVRAGRGVEKSWKNVLLSFYAVAAVLMYLTAVGSAFALEAIARVTHSK